MGLTTQFALRHGEWWLDEDTIGEISPGDACVLGVFDEAVGYILTQDHCWYFFASFGLYDPEQRNEEDPPQQDRQKFIEWLRSLGPIQGEGIEFVQRYLVQPEDRKPRWDDTFGDAVEGLSYLTTLCALPDLDIWNELEVLDEDED